VLNVRDLIRAIELTRASLASTAGNIYNVGGGQQNSVSLLDLMAMINEFKGCEVEFSHAPARPGDQLIYVSDYSKLARHTGWKPELSVRETLNDIHRWHKQNRELFKPMAEPATVPAGMEALPRVA
jgi:CDP-paratose 2-epimerase